jgi:hypothetical protein
MFNLFGTKNEKTVVTYTFDPSPIIDIISKLHITEKNLHAVCHDRTLNNDEDIS